MSEGRLEGFASTSRENLPTRKPSRDTNSGSKSRRDGKSRDW